jgi:Peptidase A4 family
MGAASIIRERIWVRARIRGRDDRSQYERHLSLSRETSMAVLAKIVAAGAVLLVVAVLAVGTARPGVAAPAAGSAVISQHAAAGIPSSATDTADVWTGYVDTACSTCHLRYVNANFKVPSISCSGSGYGEDGAWVSVWAGLDGAYSSDPTVEQVGVEGWCEHGQSGPEYKAFWDIYTSPSSTQNNVPLAIPVSPGDSISVSVYYDQSTSTYSFVLDDNTTGAGWTSVPESCPSGYTCENKTAEVIAEDPGGGPPVYDLADFGSEAFSGTTVTSYDGTKGDLCKSSLWSMQYVYEVYNGQQLASAGSLSTCSGPDGFTAKYLASGPVYNGNS